MELQKAETACRRAITTAQANYNKALLDEVNNQKELDKRRETDDKLTEIANHVHGDFLTENPNISTSAFGPHRVIPDRWKGMLPDQIAEIRKTQKVREWCWSGKSTRGRKTRNGKNRPTRMHVGNG